MSDESQYEIHADQGSGWSLLGVVNDQEDAETRAHDAHSERRTVAVKVIRCSYDEEKGEFVERRILYLGEPRPNIQAATESTDSEPVCTSSDDFFRPPARRAIRRHLRQWLEASGLVPVELLHMPDYLNRLDNAGSAMQSAVQRSAMAQSRRSGVDVQARQLELFDLIDEGMGQIRRIWRDKQRPQLTAAGIEELLGQLRTGDYGVLQFNAALTERIKSEKSLPDKLKSVLGLLEGATSKRAVVLMDNFIIDFLAEPACNRLILGNHVQYGDALLKSVAMITGQNWPGHEEPHEVRGFVGRLQSGDLPKSRQVLIKRIMTTIASQKPFGEGMPLEESGFIHLLNTAMTGEDGSYLGGEDMKDALTARSERLVTPDAIGRLTTGKERAAERIEVMLQLEPGVLGNKSKRKLGDFLVAVLDQPPNQEELCSGDDKPALRMRAVADFHRRIMASGLPPELRDKAGNLLDDICLEIMKRERILERLSASATDSTTACINLLRLCAAGTFTEGRAAEKARGLAMRMLSAPNFLDDYLSSVDKKTDLKVRLKELETLLTEAKLAKMPLGVMAGE